MKLAALFSGGKDSTLALYKAKKSNEIACLITLISKNKFSYMYHTPNISLTKKQAELMNIPIIQMKTKGEKEAELKDLEKAIKLAVEKYQIKGVVTGAVASNYQASRIKIICDKLNLKCINPLWQKDQLAILKELIKNKFEVIITQVAADGFDESWLGKKLNLKTIDELKILNKKFGVSLILEGGEGETSVLNCPLFKKGIVIKKAEKIMENECTGYLDIKKAK